MVWRVRGLNQFCPDRVKASYGENRPKPRKFFSHTKRRVCQSDRRTKRVSDVAVIPARAAMGDKREAMAEPATVTVARD